MDLIGDIEDTDRLVTTKMLYQEVSFRATWNYSRPEIWTLTAVDMINVGSDYIVSFGSLRDYMRKHQYFIRHWVMGLFCLFIARFICMLAKI